MSREGTAQKESAAHQRTREFQPGSVKPALWASGKTANGSAAALVAATDEYNEGLPMLTDTMLTKLLLAAIAVGVWANVLAIFMVRSVSVDIAKQRLGIPSTTCTR